MLSISAEELKSRIDAGTAPVIIDVREPYEYEEYNIKGILIPLGSLQSQIDELDQYSEKEVVVHCRSGARSAAACDFLSKNGFSNVKNLTGGMLEWQARFG
ncbi:MAG: rhodanese-like domain-containing protein [Flavobacteriales bacterium]|nr:rhodanese-like domain-containing protein [Flavobacteriales bacterium]